MALSTTFDTDLASIASDLGDQLVTWKGEEYICIPSSNSAKRTLGMGGLDTDASLVLTIQKSLFTDDVFPKSQEKVTFNSIVYRIENVVYDASGAIIRLFCIDSDRGV